MFEKIKGLKKYIPFIAGTILIYQIFLTIFFFSETNLNILYFQIVLGALYIILKNNKDFISKIKNKFKKSE